MNDLSNEAKCLFSIILVDLRWLNNLNAKLNRELNQVEYILITLFLAKPSYYVEQLAKQGCLIFNSDLWECFQNNFQLWYNSKIYGISWLWEFLLSVRNYGRYLFIREYILIFGCLINQEVSDSLSQDLGEQ